MSFWVVGGIYKDTKFKELAEGQKLEKYGPFKEYSEARQKWDYHSWQNSKKIKTYYKKASAYHIKKS